MKVLSIVVFHLVVIGSLAKFQFRSSQKQVIHSLIQAEKPTKLPEVFVSKTSSNLISEYDLKQLLNNHGMNKAEIDRVFVLIDKDKSNSLSPPEWSKFYMIFVKPFEFCDVDGSFSFDASELAVCLENGKGGFHFKDFENFPEIAEDLVTIFEKEDGKINFADYLFLRRISLAWKQCAVKNQLNVNQFGCALSVVITSTKLQFHEVKRLFQFALLLQAQPELHITLPIFSQVSFIYYIWDLMTEPTGKEKLPLADFEKAVDKQQFPMPITKNELINIYWVVDDLPVDLTSFASIFYIFKIYNKMKDPKTYTISAEKFTEILNNKNFSKRLLYFIDTFINPEDERYKKALESMRYNSNEEAEYLLSFVETKHKMKFRNRVRNSHRIQFRHKSKTHQYDVEPNPKNRELVFKTWGGNMGMTDLFNFFKSSWIYMEMDIWNRGWLKLEEITGAMKDFQPILAVTKKEMNILHKLIDMVSDGLPLDIKHFYDFMTYDWMFFSHRVPGTNNLVSINTCKVAMENMGMVDRERTISLVQEQAPDYSMLCNSELAFYTAMHMELRCFRKIKLYKEFDEKK